MSRFVCPALCFIVALAPFSRSFANDTWQVKITGTNHVSSASASEFMEAAQEAVENYIEIASRASGSTQIEVFLNGDQQTSGECVKYEVTCRSEITETKVCGCGYGTHVAIVAAILECTLHGGTATSPEENDMCACECEVGVEQCTPTVLCPQVCSQSCPAPVQQCASCRVTGCKARRGLIRRLFQRCRAR